MFPNKYFNLRFFAGRYFPPNGTLIRRIKGSMGSRQLIKESKKVDLYNEQDVLLVLLLDMS